MPVGVPDIRYGGVALEAGEIISWTLKAGVSPHATTLTLTPAAALRVWQLPMPQSLVFRIPQFVAGVETTSTTTFDDIYATEPDFSDPWLTKIKLQDRRWRWIGKTHTRRYNVKRRMNDAEIRRAGGTIAVAGQLTFTETSPPGGAGGPLDIRQNFLQIPKFRYFSWSLNPATNQPWTALQIAEDILTTVLELGTGFAGKVAPLTDNGFQPDEELVLGESAMQTLARALGMARAQIACWPDGRVRMYAYDVGDPTTFLPPLAPIATTASLLFRRDLDRIRPEQIRVQFEKETEYWFETAEADETYPSDHPLLTNVIQIPANETFTVTLANGLSETQEWAAGTWLPAADVMTAWGVGTLTNGGRNPILADTLEEAIRKFWFNALESLYAHAYYQRQYGTPFSKDPTPHLRIAQIRQHYRQSYQINEWYIERLVRMRAERVIVLSNIGGASQRLPSPVFCTYAIMLHLRPGKILLETKEWKGGFNLSSFEDEDGVDLDPPQPSPFKCTVVNSQLGIIRIEPYLDMHGGIYRTIPFHFANPDLLETILIPDDASVLGEAGALAETHKVAVPLTLVLATETDASGNSKLQWHTVVVRHDGAAGHDYFDYLSRRDSARFAVNLPGAAQKTLVNGDMLNLLATNEARRIYYSMRNFWVGAPVYEGFHPVEPFGHATGVTYTIEPDGACTTMVDLNDVPVPEDILTRLPPHIRRYLQGAIPSSGER